MNDEAALLAAIVADLADDTRRLGYADWLEEHDQPERAEFIRVQCRLASFDEACENPGATPCYARGPDVVTCSACGRRIELCRRERDLADNAAVWLHFPQPFEGRVWSGSEGAVRFGAAGGTACTFRRGVLEEVEMWAADWVVHGDEIRRLHPVLRVVLASLPEVRRGDRGPTPFGHGLVRLGIAGDPQGADWPIEYVEQERWRVTLPLTGDPPDDWIRSATLLHLRWDDIAFQLPPW